MTGIVVVVHPQLPTLVPIEAVDALTRPWYYTAELAASLAGAPHAHLLTGSVAPSATVVTSDLEHPAVIAHLDAGATLIAAPRPVGLAVLDTVALIDQLRTEGPWESEQTHASLLRYLVEETFELTDAVAALGAPTAGLAERAELRSELGDLLLQVVFHARIAEEAVDGPFSLDDVATTLTQKVRRRTPHLADGAAVDVATQAENWERQKRAERGDRASILDSIALGQPALALAGKVFERLRGAGFPTALIPADVRSVTVDPDVVEQSAEVQYRARLLAFVDRVRVAEARLADGRFDSWAAALADGPGNSTAGAER